MTSIEKQAKNKDVVTQKLIGELNSFYVFSSTKQLSLKYSLYRRQDSRIDHKHFAY